MFRGSGMRLACAVMSELPRASSQRDSPSHEHITNLGLGLARWLRSGELESRGRMGGARAQGSWRVVMVGIEVWGGVNSQLADGGPEPRSHTTE